MVVVSCKLVVCDVAGSPGGCSSVLVKGVSTAGQAVELVIMVSGRGSSGPDRDEDSWVLLELMLLMEKTLRAGLGYGGWL